MQLCLLYATYQISRTLLQSHICYHSLTENEKQFLQCYFKICKKYLNTSCILLSLMAVVLHELSLL